MRAWLILVVIGMLTLVACEDSAGPNNTTITFRTDPVACGQAADFEITIDGEIQGSYQFSPGSEWTFSVSAGVHSVKAQGENPESGFEILEREVTAPEGGTFVVLLTCTA